MKWLIWGWMIGSAVAQDSVDAFMQQWLEQSRRRFEEMDRMIDQMQQQMLNDQFAPGMDLQASEAQWSETATERHLKFNIPIDPKSPLEIKIEKGVIRLSGVVKEEQQTLQGKVLSQRSFNEVHTLPEDIDAEAVRYEQKDDGLLVIFPKKKQGAAPSKSVKPTPQPTATPQRLPKRSDGEIVI